MASLHLRVATLMYSTLRFGSGADLSTAPRELGELHANGAAPEDTFITTAHSKRIQNVLAMNRQENSVLGKHGRAGLTGLTDDVFDDTSDDTPGDL